MANDYFFLKDLRDAESLFQEGKTGRAVETLQTVLQMKLRDPEKTINCHRDLDICPGGPQVIIYVLIMCVKNL